MENALWVFTSGGAPMSISVWSLSVLDVRLCLLACLCHF